MSTARFIDTAPSHISLARGMVSAWGGCSAADIERFARKDGVDALELAARLLRGACEHMSVLLEVIGDGMGDHPKPQPR